MEELEEENQLIQGPDLPKNLGKILSLSYVFSTFIQSYKV